MLARDRERGSVEEGETSQVRRVCRAAGVRLVGSAWLLIREVCERRFVLEFRRGGDRGFSLRGCRCIASDRWVVLGTREYAGCARGVGVVGEVVERVVGYLVGWWVRYGAWRWWNYWFVDLVVGLGWLTGLFDALGGWCV